MRSTAFFLLTLASFSAHFLTALAKAQPIIVDTDIFSDCDDVGALAIANVLHACGLAHLRGIAIHTHSRYGALAASVVNTYYGNGDIPIAAIRPSSNETFVDSWAFLRSEYASKLAHNWPRTLKHAEDTPTPVDLYRSQLTAVDDDSMNVISIGFLTNLADILRSLPDRNSPLSGQDLVASKVRELVVMGGQYPSGREFNFASDVESTKYVLNYWPSNVPITFSGVELGGEIWSGHRLSSDVPHESPVRAAYEWCMGRCSTVQRSWDPLTVLYGVFGLDAYQAWGKKSVFAYSNRCGRNEAFANGTNSRVDDESITSQHWLKLAARVETEEVAAILNELLLADQHSTSCLPGSTADQITL